MLFSKSTRIILGPDCHEYVVEARAIGRGVHSMQGIHPGDGVVPVVRAWTEAGHGAGRRGQLCFDFIACLQL